MRHLPPLSSLRTFEAVARLGSLRLAAEELNVTPTAVSHQITGLENYCGQTLFRRRPRPLALTEAGERLFPLIRDGLDLFAVAMTQLREPEPVVRRLRVSTTNAFAARCLVPMLPMWHRENPVVEIEVIGTDAVVNLHAGEADVALRYAREMPRDGIAQELTRDRFHVVAAPSLLGSGGARSWRSLPRIAYDWLPGDTKAPTWERWETAARTRRESAGRIAMRFREELHAIEAVVAGQGVAICSDLLVRHELAEGVLVRLSSVTLEGYGLYLVTLPEQASVGSVKNFCAWMRRMFSSSADSDS
jgi:LysR family transcriptional regulator, glycine cleavage system transcriptional activator